MRARPLHLDAARMAHWRAVSHMQHCPALERGALCERCRDLEAEATRLAFAAEMAERRAKQREGVAV